jgi:mRNA interferase MazF
MSPGDVVLSRVQQSDGRLKTRPAVVLSRVPPYQDLVICGISSKIQREVAGFDDVILKTDPEFTRTGLKVDSLIRLGLLATIPTTAVAGALGSISDERLRLLQRRLADHISSPAACHGSQVGERGLQ